MLLVKQQQYNVLTSTTPRHEGNQQDKSCRANSQNHGVFLNADVVWPVAMSTLILN